jgi:transposase InsO family protein
VYLCKEKSEAFHWAKTFKAEVGNQSDRKIKKLRSDNGGEYTFKEFQNYLREAGIKQELIAAYTPQQNGTGERLNRTLCEAARSMLFKRKAPLKFWAKVIQAVAYTKNKCVTKKLLGKTLEEA